MKHLSNTSIFDKDLNPVLEIAENDDLDILVGYLKNKMSEDLTDSDAYKRYNPDHTKYADLIAKEIRDMGGNSFTNLVRGTGPSYHEIVCDVADKLNAPYHKNENIEDVEDSILETILKKSLSEMSEEEKESLLEQAEGKSGLKAGSVTTATLIGIFRSGGFYSYRLTVIIANQVAKAILGRGLTFATNAALTRFASILTGPIGWAITGIWTAVDIAGPAYKVTIPCVIHIAMLRKKLNSITCDNCHSVLTDATIKYCPECGHKIN